MAIRDSARDFWDRISPRERALVILAAVAMPLTIAIWLGLAIRDGLNAMERRNDDTRHAIEIVEDLHQRGGPTQPTEDITLPKEPMQLETYLSNAATTAGFPFKSTVSPRPTPPPKNGIVTTSVFFNLEQMEIDKLKAFLQEIEKSKIVVITHLDLKRSFKDKKKLDAVTIEVSTYSKPDQGGDKKDDKAGSGSGSDKKGG